MNHSESEATTATEWLNVVATRVAGIRYGSVLITVHEGQVTQVEAVEKTRLAPETRSGKSVRLGGSRLGAGH